MGTWIVSLSSVAVCLTLLGLLLVGSYSKQLPAQGVVVPTTGIISIKSQSSGFVRRLLVTEGGRVEAGTPLAEIELHRTSLGGSSEAEMAVALQEKRKSIERALELLPKSTVSSSGDADKRIHIVQERIRRARDRLGIQEERADAAMKLYEAWRSAGTQALSRYQIEQQYDTALQLISQTADAKDQLLQQEQDLSALLAERGRLESTAAQERSQLVQALADVKNSIIDNDVARGEIIRSPVKGRVSMTNVLAGQFVDPSSPPLLSIVDEESPLIVEAWIPASVNDLPFAGQRASIVIKRTFGQSHVVPATVAQASSSPYSAAQIRDMRGLEVDVPHYRVSLAPEGERSQGRIAGLKPGAVVSVRIASNPQSIFRTLFNIN
ncbi:HlyD family efflux transporter periplasmic adaptor subunit [Stenotrophomonas sp.]|uniref:HlyD family secretion protein n=1 Tax=Stenotrophomonas sp. TaxID=69392 RepID=UPI00258E72D5|nr:HlyD family efflux transporter periplasmic adaptor subunit [Stenotrophomonas sp.]MCR1569005.1 HlyD family secretion protein [Stenotrophomonas sp.]